MATLTEEVQRLRVASEESAGRLQEAQEATNAAENQVRDIRTKINILEWVLISSLIITTSPHRYVTCLNSSEHINISEYLILGILTICRDELAKALLQQDRLKLEAEESAKVNTVF